jgi:hypothetical protein
MMPAAPTPADGISSVAHAVWQRCAATDFAGHDPYDGLKSKTLAPLLDRSRLLRLAVIQGVKRSPINLRPLLRISRGHNPKGLALLLQSASLVPSLATPPQVSRLVDIMVGLASRPDGEPVFPSRATDDGAAAAFSTRGAGPAGWGYDFPWQSRAFLQPAFYPTVVCTSFVVDGINDIGHPAALAVTTAAADFVTGHLHRHEDQTGICYSYSPRDRTRVFNASLFAGKILARAARVVGPPRRDAWRNEAIKTVDYVVARQRDDGAWVYGEADHWQWIDGLHTGFVLETIAAIARLIDEPGRWETPLERGLAYYRRHLLGPDLVPYYYADQPWPLDSHTVAQAVLTLLSLADDRPGLAADARRILDIGVARLYDPATATFAFQRGRLFVTRTPFLRWSQAWMLRALAAWVANQERGR